MTRVSRRIAPAAIAGLISLTAAIAVYWIYPLMTVFILGAFVVLCLIACFKPEMQFFGPVIYRGFRGQQAVSLTFDDGPSPGVTPPVLDLLDRYAVKATFFVSGQNAQKNPDLIAEILRRGHDIGNHSFSHDPFLMLKGVTTLRREIVDARDELRRQGVETRAFRPPVGIINPKLHPLLAALDMVCVTFSCRPYDVGNRNIQHLDRRVLGALKDGDIILLHDCPPPKTADIPVLLNRFASILDGIRQAGFRVLPVSERADISIMTRIEKN